MNGNLSFYKFIRKQIIIIIILSVLTGPGYVFMGYLYTSMVYEIGWLSLIFLISIYGYFLYKNFSKKLTIHEKDRWLKNVKIYMFINFSLWTLMFFYYISYSNIEMHYIAIATQLGTSVVAATLLASQRKLVFFTVISLMFPLFIYFINIGDIFSYILAFFTFVLSSVLLYAAQNTNDYIQKSNYQAYHDHLTTLGNRRYFLEILNSSIRESKNTFSYLLLIDLDHFKTVNDTLGHDVGDKLLQEVSKRMKKLSVKSNNVIARLGGDEFCILSEAYSSKDDCIKNAELFSIKLLKSVKSNYVIDENHLYISASIGVSIINNNTDINSVNFIKEADMAMYEAKNNGRDGVIIFNDELYKIVQNKLEIERLLPFAIKKNEISLNYQAQVDKNEKIVACEVLVRWKNEKLGFIGPNIFIEIAENLGYILELGEFILRESFKTINEWSNKNMNLESVSINISIRQLLDNNFLLTIDKLYNKYIGENCNINIIFEITESVSADNFDNLIKIIETLKKYNITFSMDDFGTGYSSLSYLSDIPISELKIDKSFVDKISTTKDVSLIDVIIEISKKLSLRIVAEGIEKEYQKKYLQELECDLYQGYLFSKPVTKDEFEKLCTK